MTDLTISIVNHNNRGLLDRCLRSIYETTEGLNFEVFVVDNRSQDGSPGMVMEKYPQVRLIVNTEPKGFSENHNTVLRAMNGRYVLLLNEDTEVLPGSIETMYRYLERRTEAGVVGCRLLNADGTVQESCFRLPSLTVLFLDAFVPDRLLPRRDAVAGRGRRRRDIEREVPYMIGACLMLPRKVIETVGLLDERFFVFDEDADLCLRVARAGWKVVFLPDAEIIHHGGASIQRDEEAAVHNYCRSMSLFFRKHYGSWSLPPLWLLMVIGAMNRVAAWSAVKLLRPRKKNLCSRKIARNARIIAWHIGLGRGKRT
ncbi:MAG: glycosyltransferase family 2 protein [bacterium]